MMRSIVRALALTAVAALPAAAQMPPAIQKPIDAARRQANKTSSQINQEQKVGNEQQKASPMPAPQAQGTKTAPAKQSAPNAAVAAAADSAAKKKAAADSAAKRGSVSQSGSKGTVTFYRETFSFSGDGRRDPFLSLMATGELRPMMSDITLVGIIYDESGRNSVAILVDASAGGQTYRKKVGDSLGRIKVSKITEKDITLSVDEFGFSRSETLQIDRTPRTGARRPQ